MWLTKKLFIYLVIALICLVSVGYAETVHLQWIPPSDGGPVSGYNFYYGEVDDISSMTKIAGIEGTSYTLDLPLHTCYYFYVQAYNNAGAGPLSDVRYSNISLRFSK